MIGFKFKNFQFANQESKGRMKMLEKIGRISFVIWASLLVLALISPFIYYAFNVNIFEYIDPQLMLRIGVASLCVTLCSILILYIRDIFDD